MGDSRRWRTGRGGGGSGIWAQESSPTPPVLMTLQDEIQKHTQLRRRAVLSQQRAARGPERQSVAEKMKGVQ